MLSSLFDDDAQSVEGFLTEAFESNTVRKFEAPLLQQGVPLMQQAASAITATAERMLAHANIPLSQSRIVLLAGAGNNGGDGLYSAASLSQAEAHVTVIAVGRSLHNEAIEQVLNSDTDILLLDQESDIPGAVAPNDAEEQLSHCNEALELLRQSDLIIDAMTGIGLHGALQGIPAQIAKAIGESERIPLRMAFPPAAYRAQSPMVLAVDVPSGVGVDDGSLPGPYIPADVTVTFGTLKPCALLPPASYVCGQSVLVDFNFPTDQEIPKSEVMTARKCAQSLRMPQLGDSKYTRSVVGLITGSGSYPGAGLLSTLAASRSNVGMVRYLGPEQVQDHIMQVAPETVFSHGKVQTWVVGSGVPSSATANADDEEQINRILSLLESYNADTSSESQNVETTAPLPPIVVDAGALSLLPPHVSSSLVITPHAGELARLLQARGEDVDASGINAEPLRWATRAWEVTGATVLLKGAITVIVGDDGEGSPRIITVGRAPAWLSTAGAGDVLAGVIASMLAQNADNLSEHPELISDYVAAGAYVHALAAAVASESSQLAWSLPILADPEDLSSFSHDYDARFSVSHPSGSSTLGHPIIAGDLIQALPEAYSVLTGLYDDAAEIHSPVDTPYVGDEDLTSAEENRK